MVMLERLRCTNCGADFDCYTPSTSVLRCSREGCHALFFVRQARAFAQVQMEEDQAIGILRQLMMEALDQHNADNLRERAVDIRKYIQDDFHARFCEALACKRSGDFNTYHHFLCCPPRETMTSEARDWALQIALREFDPHDEEALRTFIHSSYPKEAYAKIALLNKALDRLTDQENKYAKIPRDIFICHSSSDKSIALDVYHALADDGISCWISSENLRLDTMNYWDDITYAIQNARLILVIGSRQCMLRPDPLREMDIADKAKLARVEYKIDRVEHTAYFKHYFDGKQWVDGRNHGVTSLNLLCERVYMELHKPEPISRKEKSLPTPMPEPVDDEPPVNKPPRKQPTIQVFVFFLSVLFLTSIVGVPNISVLGVYQSLIKSLATMQFVQTTAAPAPSNSVVATSLPSETSLPAPSPMAIPTAQATVAPISRFTPTITPSIATANLLSTLVLHTKAYEGTVEGSYQRHNPVIFSDPYAIWDQSGILTFRGDAFRRNAAFGNVNITEKKLAVMWNVPMKGGIKAKGTSLNGVSWPGQPLIVKWPIELRSILGLADKAKNRQALKEVMVGGQNGKLYFLNLETGEATRDPITEIWPFNGVLSLQTNASPILAAGQHTGVLENKTVDNGLHLYNLMNNQALTIVYGKDRFGRSDFSGVRSSPAFDKATGTMVFGGENGILYTMEPEDDFNPALATLKINPATQRYTWLADKQNSKNTNIDGAVAMFKQYAYFGDHSGIVQCVDVNTLTPVWAVNTGDNVDATVALDKEGEFTVALYTANTILNQGKDGVCTIRRLDALIGLQAWAFTVPDLSYTTEAEVGVYASPVVGENEAKDLVFFTATNGRKGATLYALNKRSGSLVWNLPLSAPTLSSPVAVYGDTGDAWVLQAAGDGTLRLVEALTGRVAATLKLEGGVACSPAVYRDMLVIATTGQNASIYGIRLE